MYKYISEACKLFAIAQRDKPLQTVLSLYCQTHDRNVCTEAESGGRDVGTSRARVVERDQEIVVAAVQGSVLFFLLVLFLDIK